MTADLLGLISILLGALWLGGAIVYARANRPKETYQLRRVPRAAGAFIVGSTLIDLLLYALLGELDVIFFHVVLGRALLIGMVFFLSLLLFDVVAVILGAKRTPGWLAAGIAAAVVIAYGWLFILTSARWGAVPDIPSLLLLSGSFAPAAAGLVWWSELQRPDEVADPGIFD